MNAKLDFHHRRVALRSLSRLILLSAVFCLTPLAFGNGVVVRVLESPDGVVMASGGSLNVSALFYSTNVLTYAPRVQPNEAEFRLGAEDLDNMTDDGDLYSPQFGEEINAPQNFGPGTGTGASNGSGPVFGVTIGFNDKEALLVPNEYVSGSQISSTAEFNGSSFVSMGLTPGTYTWTWGAGSLSESITMLIGQDAVDAYDAAARAAAEARARARAALTKKRKKLQRQLRKFKRKGETKKARKVRARLKRISRKLRSLR